MEEPKKETRKLVVNFDKRRLHSSIMLHMRRMRIPSSMIGADLLKGVVFGVMRHPEISIREAVSNAVNASKVPGSTMSVDDGFGYIMDVLEVASETEFSEDERTPEEMEETLKSVVSNFITEINKEYCYEITIQTLDGNLKGFRKYTIGGEIIKCMLFKKLYAPESTYECMREYALRKVGTEIDGKAITMEEAMEYVNPLLGKKEPTEQDLKALVEEMEECAYKSQPAE